MNKETLGIIQKLANIGRVLCKIIAICCIVGAIGCVIGIISLVVIDIETIKIGDLTIHGIIEENANVSIGTIYASIVTGLILCIAEFIVAKMAEKYFKNEIAAGTPFTFEGAKEMLRLGIYIIGISIATVIFTNVSYAIVEHFYSKVADLHMEDFNQTGLGVTFIITSLLCKLGAETKEENTEITN